MNEIIRSCDQLRKRKYINPLSVFSTKEALFIVYIKVLLHLKHE